MSWLRPAFSNRLFRPALNLFREPKANPLRILPASISPLRTESKGSAPQTVSQRSFVSYKPLLAESKYELVAYSVLAKDFSGTLATVRSSKPSTPQDELELLKVLSPLLPISEQILDLILEVLSDSKDWKTVEASIPLLKKVVEDTALPTIREKALDVLVSWASITYFVPKINSALRNKAGAALVQLNELPSFQNTIDEYVGVAYLSQEKYQKAVELFEKGLKKKIETLGEKHPDVATIHFFLGCALKMVGKHEEAIDSFLKALEIQSVNLGADHKDLAAILETLGKTYLEAKNYNSAIKYLNDAYHLVEKASGPGHADLYTCAYNLGEVYLAKKDISQAMNYFSEALTFFNKKEFENPKSSEDKLELSNILFSLGVGKFFQDDPAEALGHLQETLTLKKELFGSENPETYIVHTAIALSFYALKDFKKASDQYLEVIPLQKQGLGDQHNDVAISLRGLANSFLGQNDLESALVNYKEAYTIFQKTLGDENPLTKNCKLSIQLTEEGVSKNLAESTISQS